MQRFYGIDLDGAVDGAHSAEHVAMLVSQLPRTSQLAIAHDKDAAWTMADTLLAVLINRFTAFAYGFGGKGKSPEPIGPSWLVAQSKRTRSLPARSMPIDQLMKELSKPRR